MSSTPTEPSRSGRLSLGQVEIAWHAWGQEDRRPVILIHGGAAHARWWSWTAPCLTDFGSPIAVDLSGHGESGPRPRYSYDEWAEELWAIADLHRTDEPPIFVGHSMGGIVAAHAAAQRPDRELAGLVLVDAPLLDPPQQRLGSPERRFGGASRYPTHDQAVARFRPFPVQVGNQDQLVHWVAQRSVRRTPDGLAWTWHFDPGVFVTPPHERPSDVADCLAKLGCPVTFVVGGASRVVEADERSRMRDLIASRWTGDDHYVEVPGGGHHLMFDQPAALALALEGCLARWVRSGPRRKDVDDHLISE